MTYLTFLSDYCKNLYPENKPNSFKNVLASPLVFDNDQSNYEAALCEISYNNNYIVQDNDLEIVFFDWLVSQQNDQYGKFYTLSLSQTIINNPLDLANQINTSIQSVCERFKENKTEFFTWEANHIIWFNGKKSDYCTIILKNDICQWLGAAPPGAPSKKIMILADSKPKDFFEKDGKKYFSRT